MKRDLTRGGPHGLRSRRFSSSGFTLLELLLVVVILGVIASVAMPGVARVARVLRIEGSAQGLVGDLHRARTEAIKRNETVWLAIAGPSSSRVEWVGVRRLDDEVAFTTGSPDTVRFTGFGSAADGHEVYTLRLGEHERRVVVDAAGQARVE